MVQLCYHIIISLLIYLIMSLLISNNSDRINCRSSPLKRLDFVAKGLTPGSRFLKIRIGLIFAAVTVQTNELIIISFPSSFTSNTTRRCRFMKSWPSVRSAHRFHVTPSCGLCFCSKTVSSADVLLKLLKVAFCLQELLL